ncbi:MAG: hypothetical protein HC927_04755 [Deltaproteobacteria bacterium]|nr:hypothetical protein [Deltaproteobacteria bacterium]
MISNPEAFQHVLTALARLERELETLQDDLEVARQQEDEGLSYSRVDVDLGYACASVETASERLVERIRNWMPLLVPSPRRLDEILATIFEWYPTAAQSDSLLEDARKLFAQLRAHSYARTPKPAQFPELDGFAAELRATLERLAASA